MKPSKNTTLTRLYNEQAGECAYCGEKMLLGVEKSNHPRHASVDHIVPRSKGGLSFSYNLVACCRSCNGDKGDKPLLDYLWKITRGHPERHPMFDHPQLMR